MRALFGVVSLLVVLAIVGLLAVKQLKAVGHVGAGAGLPATTGVEGADGAASTVREQSMQIQQRIQSDVTKALEQGAAAHKDEPGQ